MILNSNDKINVSFEELHIRHFNLLIDLKNSQLNNRFFKLAIINTFDDLTILLNHLEKNKNKCIIAINNKKIIGYVIVFPINDKKTCLKIDKPEIFENNSSITDRSLFINLIKKSISITDIRTSSWIINSNINDSDLISSARELGFQPIRENILWQKPILENIDEVDVKNNKDINYFSKIKKENIQKVLNFIRTNQTIFFRNTLDYTQQDIIRRSHRFSGVVFENNQLIIAILLELNYQNKDTYELHTSLGCDDNLRHKLKFVIRKLFTENPFSYLKTDTENKKLTNCLSQLGLKEFSNELILVRNTLIKNETKKISPLNKSFESILESLNPRQNPFPTPFQVKKID